jgi:hypothetical protein
MITQESRYGWLEHAERAGGAHVAVPIEDYRETLDRLDTLEAFEDFGPTKPWWRYVEALVLIALAAGIGYGLMHTFCTGGGS